MNLQSANMEIIANLKLLAGLKTAGAQSVMEMYTELDRSILMQMARLRITMRWTEADQLMRNSRDVRFATFYPAQTLASCSAARST